MRTSTAWKRFGRGPAVWCAVAAAIVLPTLGPAPGVLAASSSGSRAPAVVRDRPVPVHDVAVRSPATRPMPGWRPRAAVWTSGTADVEVPSAPGAAARAAGLPVWVGQTAGAAAVPVSRLRVTAAPRRDATRAGVTGLLASLARGDAAVAPGRVEVGFDVSAIAGAYGGDYASRLRLVELPACALTTPEVPSCRSQTPLPSRADAGGRLVADVALPAAGIAAAARLGATAAGAAAPAVVLAATSGTSGSGGDFGASGLSSAGSWTAGGASGDWEYAYPVPVPPVPGGLAPVVALRYSSQSADGLTSSTNNQASWIGDGWSYSPGFVERSYASCADNPAGPTQTGDLCWNAGDTITLSLAGRSTTLVHDDATGAWHPETDDGERVQLLAGAANGAHNGEHWLVTATDGTRYYFGLDQLPGFATGDATTSSTWTVPVFATSSGQSCYSATFSNSWCAQAWRWNLDYVVDTHGDAVSYFYAPETNSYSRDNGTTANATYVRGGTLQRIQYGQRDGAVYSTTPAAQVTFTVDGRCANSSCPTSSLSSSTASAWPDVPFDLNCATGAACAQTSPSFWSEYRLAGITTQALAGGALASVDSWGLARTFPATGDATQPALWLSSIARTGLDGGSVALPPTTFAGQALANRVVLTNGYLPITRYRMTTVTTETGAVIQVGYSSPACGSGTPAAVDTNTQLCFPAYWTPSGQPSPVLDWFNKFVVNQVTAQDTTGGGPTVPTVYTYAGAAWHHDDTPITKAKYRTWSEFRGFRTVQEQTGQAPDPITQTTATYYQGMDGDSLLSGATKSVTVGDSLGEQAADGYGLDGQAREQVVSAGAGGGVLEDSVLTPWQSAPTATQARSGLPSLVARLGGMQEARTFTTLASGGSRERDTVTTYDGLGRPASVDDAPDVGDPSQTTCTTTTYASNSTAWIQALPARIQTVSVPCGATPSMPGNAVSDVLTFYDGSTVDGAAPSVGDVTMTQEAAAYASGAPTYATRSTRSVDQYGRPVRTTDAAGAATTYAYAPASGAEPAQVAVTDAVGLVTTTTVDPARDLPTRVVDAAGYATSEAYDALGRRTAVWKPGQSQATDPATTTYSYQESSSAPSVVTTGELNDDGATYRVSETLYDALGRARETQTQTPDGSRDVADASYDSHGWTVKTSDAYAATGPPSATLVQAADSQTPSQTGYVYDGAGRVTARIAYSFGAETWRTTASYGGDSTTVVPPNGGTPTTSITDGRGLRTALLQYHAGATPDPSGPASDYDRTTYVYTGAGQLAMIVDPGGNTWSYGYDPLGDRVIEQSPDAGATISAFDPVGRVLAVTDARGSQTSYTYDASGRRTGEFDTTGGSAESSTTQVAGWTYDTVKKGLPATETSFSGGSAYTSAILGYDAHGQPAATKVTIPAAEGALAGDYVTQFSYSPTGRLAGYTDSAAGGMPQETVSLGYDQSGSPTSVRGIADYVDDVAYDQLGDPLRITLGPSTSSVWLTRTYDQQTLRLNQQTTTASTLSTPVDTTTYSYNAGTGQVASVQHAQQAGTVDVECYQYDGLERLTEAWAQGSAGCAATPSTAAEGGPSPYWQSFRYDVTGNRTSDVWHATSGPDSVYTSGYPAAGAAQPHALTSQAISGPLGSWTATYGYDASGNLTSVANGFVSQALTWDDQGRLATLVNGSATTGYTYDADGRLLLRHDPGQTTLFLADAEVVLNTSSGQLSGTRFYSLDGQVVAARSSSGSVAYLVPDRQETASIAVDSQTQAVTVRWYDPFGVARWPVPGSWPGGTRGYAGGSFDGATGYTDLGAREYDPANGRFLSVDPVTNGDDPQSLNGYAYADNAASTLSDPSGLMLVHDTGGAADWRTPGQLPAGCGWFGCYTVPYTPPPPPAHHCSWFSWCGLTHAAKAVSHPFVAAWHGVSRAYHWTVKHWDTISNVVHTVTTIANILAVVTAWVPVVGEATAGFAAVMNVTSALVSAVDIGVNLHRHRRGAAMLSALDVVLGVMGAGSATELRQAEDGMRDAKAALSQASANQVATEGMVERLGIRSSAALRDLRQVGRDADRAQDGVESAERTVRVARNQHVVIAGGDVLTFAGDRIYDYVSTGHWFGES